jgi:putative hemolysin
MSTGPAFRLALIGLVTLALSACVPATALQPEVVAETAQPLRSPTSPSAEASPATAPDVPESGKQPSSGETATGLANPASINCVEQGGALTIEKRGDGAEFGVCTFDDNRQCEEWALLRGNCLAGGIKATGFVTPAARYCGITGGYYAPTGDSGTEAETGVCTLPNGVECDVWDYYNGKCPS